MSSWSDRVGESNKECFFFFQAEDGIRDLTVTGVQTCALPISLLPPGHLQDHGNGDRQPWCRGLGLEDAQGADGAVSADPGREPGVTLTAARRAAASPADRSACRAPPADRKSTRLNSSHSQISYAVFCFK